jgi:hypothetical protein
MAPWTVAAWTAMTVACSDPTAPAGETDADTSTSAGSSGAAAGTSSEAGETGSPSSGPDATTTSGSSPDATDATATTSDGSSTGAIDPLQDAIARGIEGAALLSEDDPVALLLLDVMHRRYGIEAFSGASARFDELLARWPDPPIDAIAFRRVFDPTQTLTPAELAMIAPGVNEVTVPALHCDTLPQAADYGDRLVADAALGSYELTHVALAMIWITELGCTPPTDAAFYDQVLVDTLALVDTRDGVTDLEIEAAIFGALLGGTAVVDGDVLDAVLDAQLDDGTWPHDPGDRDGIAHTTTLALMLLLELSIDPLDPFVAGAPFG